MDDGSHPSEAAPPQASREAEAARRRGMLMRVAIRTRANAELVFPAAPSLVGHYADILGDQFAALGRPFSAQELDGVRNILRAKLKEAFDTSASASVVVRYHTADDGSLRIDYGIAAANSTLAEAYDHWLQTREPPLFGALPDARVMAAAEALPAGARVVDIGAGTGRNSLPLARRGLSVVAIEQADALARVMEAEAAKDSLAVTVVRADVLRAPLPDEARSALLVLASQVTSHFRSAADLRALFRACAEALSAGGHAVVTAFVTASEYQPERTARELGQLFWTTFYTPEELAGALSGLPLAIVEDIDALKYEQAHVPAESWPQTGWFEAWARGEDVFARQASPPITLRWLVLARRPGSVPEP